jgi:hypothetical protein
MSEHAEQVVIFSWAAMAKNVYPELALLFAVANGAKLPYTKDAQGRRFSRQAMILKAEGMKPGVPDMVLPVARGGYHGLFIELKFGKNTPSPEQEEWIMALKEQGYLAKVCYGAESAIAILKNYLELGWEDRLPK